MGAPSDILGLGEIRPVEVTDAAAVATLNLSSGYAQYELVASTNRNVDIINRTAREGQWIVLCGPDANIVTVRDNQTGSNIHLANGTTSRALSQYDTLVLRYQNGFWIEVAFTNAV
ncbi:MAG TPA: hypothetical protein VIG24_00230 [Acidimicrobiia bacterium]